MNSEMAGFFRVLPPDLVKLRSMVYRPCLKKRPTPIIAKTQQQNPEEVFSVPGKRSDRNAETTFRYQKSNKRNWRRPRIIFPFGIIRLIQRRRRQTSRISLLLPMSHFHLPKSRRKSF